jgi:hypothetical protein
MINKALVIPIFTFVASACVVLDKYRKEIVQPHENHCRCRTELKLRPPLQHTIQYNTNLLLSIMTMYVYCIYTEYEALVVLPY